MKSFQKLYTGSELTNRASLQEQYSSFDLKEWLKGLYAFKKTDRLLDLGCGNGKDLLYFAPSLKEGIGLDSSKNLIETAKERQKEREIKNLTFQVADVDSLQLSKKFDKIISNFAFYYLDAEKVIPVIAESLLPGGMVFIGGSPDENAPELNSIMEMALDPKDIPETYAKGFSDVRKFENIFRSHFKSVQFYRFVNVVRFPEKEHFMQYLVNTTLYQGLREPKKEKLLDAALEFLNERDNSWLTKVVDVLRASN